MATLTKTWSFVSDTESWAITPGNASTTAGWAPLATDNATGDVSSGCIQFATSGKSKSSPGYIEITGTWEALFGIAAGSIVTEIGTGPLASFYWKCALWTTGSGDSVGPFELRDGAAALQGTFSAALNFGATSAWAARAGAAVAVPAGLQASNSTIKLRLGVNTSTSSTTGSAVTARVDRVSVAITYTSPRRGLVSFAEVEVPDVPVVNSAGYLSFSEIEVPTAPRSGFLSFSEVELPTAPRRGFVSFSEMEIPAGARSGLIAWSEVEVPAPPTTDRSGVLSFAELEVPIGARSGAISFSEIEAPLAPRRGLFSFAELETPNAARRGLLSWSEVQTTDAPRSGKIAWTELEAPPGARSGKVSFSEVQTPDAARRGVLSFADLEAPDAPRKGLLAWSEIQAPDLVVTTDRIGFLSQSEIEVPDGARRGVLSFTEIETGNGARNGVLSFSEIETPEGGRRGLLAWSELEAPALIADRAGFLAWSEIQIPAVPAAPIILASLVRTRLLKAHLRRTILSSLDRTTILKSGQTMKQNFSPEQPIHPEASRPFGFDFTDDLDPGETIVSAEVTALRCSGEPDETPSAILDGVPTIDGNVVKQLISNGKDGVDYELTFKAVTNLGNTLVEVGYLFVRSDP